MTLHQQIEQEIDSRSSEWEKQANEYANEETKSYKKDIKDVCYYERYIAYEYAVQEGFEQGCNFALGLSRWVKVEDGLPDEGQEVYVIDRHGEQDTATFGDGEFHGYGPSIGTFTHWAPQLPPPTE